MQKNEDGRSMVEMLGVLAIAGVITLGGISGFRMAMNKFRANAIAEVIALASMYAQSHNTKINSLDDFSDDYEESKPMCVEKISAEINGKVTVTFEDSDNCESIMQMVGATFGQCRWEAKSFTGTFNPNASSQNGVCQ